MARKVVIYLKGYIRNGGQATGECSIDASGEIGLMLLPEYWRQGFGTGTVRELIGIGRYTVLSYSASSLE